jgi:hypothetical protein
MVIMVLVMNAICVVMNAIHLQKCKNLIVVISPRMFNKQ